MLIGSNLNILYENVNTTFKICDVSDFCDIIRKVHVISCEEALWKVDLFLVYGRAKGKKKGGGEVVPMLNQLCHAMKTHVGLEV
jgi:hypothetical protein